MPTPPARHLARPPAGGPGDCCCSSSGLPPRSWPPWWPRPPCSPSPNRHAGYPASRCRRRQPGQHRRLRRPPPLLPGSRPPRLPLPPLRTLGGEPSADRPRPPDRPRPKRRPRSAARHHHGALDRWRHHPAHRDRATDHGRAHHHRAIDHGSVHDHAGDHDQHCTHHRADDQRRADLDRADVDHDRADHDRGGNDHDRTSGSCPAANQQASRPRPSVRSCPSWVCCTCCAGWFHKPAGPTPGGAAPTTPAAAADPPGRQAGNQPWVAFLEFGQPRVHPLGRQQMAVQDQRGDAQARWRLSEKPSTPNAAMAVHRPRRARRIGCQRPGRKARAQGRTTPGGNSLSWSACKRCCWAAVAS